MKRYLVFSGNLVRDQSGRDRLHPSGWSAFLDDHDTHDEARAAALDHTEILGDRAWWQVVDTETRSVVERSQVPKSFAAVFHDPSAVTPEMKAEIEEKLRDARPGSAVVMPREVKEVMVVYDAPATPEGRASLGALGVSAPTPAKGSLHDKLMSVPDGNIRVVDLGGGRQVTIENSSFNRPLRGSEPPHVFCVPSQLVSSVCGSSSRFVEGGRAALDRLLARARYLPRTEGLEKSSEWKQVIPYVVVRGLDFTSDEPLIMRYLRGDEGERRLDDLFSIGYGGHVERERDAKPPWDDFDAALVHARDRELMEEHPGAADAAGETRLVGLVIDEDTPVGRVHLGVVYVKDYDLAIYGATEHAPDEPWTFMLPLSTLKALPRSRYEPWSRLAIEALYPKGPAWAPEPQPVARRPEARP